MGITIRTGYAAQKIPVGGAKTYGYDGVSLGLGPVCRPYGFFGIVPYSIGEDDHCLFAVFLFFQYVIEDGSYLRLKSISLTYNFPKKWLAPLQIQSLSIYGNIQNLFTITGYDGYDPEIGANGQSVILQNIDNYRYPSQRIYTFGLKLAF